ncbi:uncharacterized protein LOC141613619 [Silene latifolia]|uniref:uncharacterized protein LOC141613619 n=1 Tax=Silene latifolia TaxID=37657 RepID=UPI003D77B5D3
MKKEIAEVVSRCLVCQRVKKGNNMIWVIVDRLTKTSHFIPMKDTWSKAELAKAYVKNIVKLHGIPKDIVFDRDSRFISKFWQELQECMAPFEALYGRKCRSPVCWDDVTDAMTPGPELIQQMVEQVHVIRQKMRAAQDRQKRYADLKRSEIEFALRKYVSDPTHVLAAETIEMDENLSYMEVAKEILDRKVRNTRNSEIALVKVLWFNHNVEEATWEVEAEMKEKYPHLFA